MVPFAYSGWNIDDVEFIGVASTAPYDVWAGGPFLGTLTDPSVSLDFDNGGLDTGVEWVVGGDPTDGSDDASKAPTMDNTSDATYFIFSYRRSDAANVDANTAIAVQYGSDLERLDYRRARRSEHHHHREQ